MGGVDGGGRSRDEESTDERESRSVREGEESNVGVDGFFPGCAKHFYGGDGTEFPELREEGKGERR